jgi:hypothetical protein
MFACPRTALIWRVAAPPFSQEQSVEASTVRLIEQF